VTTQRQEDLLQAFLTIITTESDVISVFLSGSLARGTGDDLSDIDLTVVTKNGKGDTWFSSLQPTVEGISKVLLPIRTDTAKRCAVFVFDDLVEMTVTVFEESEVKPSPAYSEIKPLHDPLGLSATLKSKSSLLPKKARIEALIATESLFLWGTLAVRKRLLRDNVWDARDALEKLRYLVIRLMNLRDAKLDGYKNIEKTLDAKSIILLSKTASGYDKDAVLSALAACFDLFVRTRDEVFAQFDIKPNEVATNKVSQTLNSFR